MVQSTEHEVYQLELPNHELGGWGLGEQYHSDESNGDQTNVSGLDGFAQLGDRTTLWVVNPPGESDWVSSVSFTESAS